MATRKMNIETIAHLYPADSEYNYVRETGMKLMLLALGKRWRSLPDEVLNEYANLCLRELEDEHDALPSVDVDLDLER